MDERSKRKLVERYMRGAQKEVGYEERKARKERKRGADRGWDRDEEFDEEATFQKIRRSRPRQTRPQHAVDPDLPRATVVAVHHGSIELDSGDRARLAPALAADQELRLAVGDEVAVSDRSGQARIEALIDRRSVLSRPDPAVPQRQRVLAANVDVAVIVVVADDLKAGLIDRVLLALHDSGIEPIVCVNKLDLCPDRDALDQQLAPYRDLGLTVVPCAARTGTGVDALQAAVAGQTCVVVGHSGVGKSSLLNAMDPDGSRATGDVRDYDGKGRHTTTWSSLRELTDGTRVIDTPGVRAFGLDNPDPAEIRAGFPEFEPIAAGCRFRDCQHLDEPDCAVRSAVKDGRVSKARYDSYCRILMTTSS